MDGANILPTAAKHIGERYVLGAHAPLGNKNWTGPWDCAEYCSWLTYQTYGIVFGCGTEDLSKADPYSGYWLEEAKSRGRVISVEVAARTPGAFLVRKAVAGPVKMIGHVAIATGKGTVYEAAGAKIGVREGPIAGRRWDIGVLLPDVDYDNADQGQVIPDPAVDTASDDGPIFILRRQAVPKFDDHVVELQIALKEHNVDPGKADGFFGSLTEASVYTFQVENGLIPDGEVGPKTGNALGLAFWPTPTPGNGGAAQSLPFTEIQYPPLPTDAFGTVVNASTRYADIRDEYQQLFALCAVQDKQGEIAELTKRIGVYQSRYQSLVDTFKDEATNRIPWFFVALIHAMEASGNIGLFRTHLHNGDPLTGPTVHVPKDRPSPVKRTYSWEESARDALDHEGYFSNTDWSLPRMLFLLESYNGMGPRKKRHATAYLWSYSNHYVKGKYVGDGVWSDDAVSRQPGAASILKQLVANGIVKF